MLAQSLKTFHWKNKPGEPVLKYERKIACKAEPKKICTDKSESEPKFSKAQENLDSMFHFDSLGIIIISLNVKHAVRRV